MTSASLIRSRRTVVILITLAALGVAALGAHYADDRSPGRIDSAIDGRLRHRLHGHLRFLHHLVALADPVSVVIGCAVLAVLFFLAGRRRAALLAILGPAAAAGIAEFVLKPLINRRIHDSLSFPSGHTTAAVSVAIVIIIALLGPSRPSWSATVRYALSAIALLGAAGVATALVGSGYHYSTDTLGGFCVAVGVVLAVALAIDAVHERQATVTVASSDFAT